MEKQGSLGHFSTSLLLRPNRLLKRNDFGDRRNLGNESPLSDLRPLPLERVVLSLRFNALASVVLMVVTVVLVLVVIVVVECTALSSFPNTSVNAVALDTVVASSVIAVAAIVVVVVVVVVLTGGDATGREQETKRQNLGLSTNLHSSLMKYGRELSGNSTDEEVVLMNIWVEAFQEYYRQRSNSEEYLGGSSSGILPTSK
uniref:Uncharacterized protein n=1 Tax=Glossina pallidipes TaxID=7398 RepID=A0A1B0A1V6_GLOPL